MRILPAFLSNLFGRTPAAPLPSLPEDDVILTGDAGTYVPDPHTSRTSGAPTITVSPEDGARALRAAVLACKGNPERKTLLLETMAYDPAELLAFAVASGDEDAARMVFAGIIASTWHTTTANGWQDRWQGALDAGLDPRTAFEAMHGAWIERSLVGAMVDPVLRSAAGSGMKEDHIDFPPFWEAARKVAEKHKLVEAVVREGFRRQVGAFEVDR